MCLLAEFFLLRTELRRDFQLVICLGVKVWKSVAYRCPPRRRLDMGSKQMPSIQVIQRSREAQKDKGESQAKVPQSQEVEL